MTKKKKKNQTHRILKSGRSKDKITYKVEFIRITENGYELPGYMVLKKMSPASPLLKCVFFYFHAELCSRVLCQDLKETELFITVSLIL